MNITLLGPLQCLEWGLMQVTQAEAWSLAIQWFAHLWYGSQSGKCSWPGWDSFSFSVSLPSHCPLTHPTTTKESLVSCWLRCHTLTAHTLVSPCSAPSSVTAVEFVFLFLTVTAYPCKPVLWTCDSYSPADHSTTYKVVDDLPLEAACSLCFCVFPSSWLSTYFFILCWCDFLN